MYLFVIRVDFEAAFKVRSIVDSEVHVEAAPF